MDKYIEKIYRMMKSPIVTPYNLLENAKLENYQYVKYFKGENGLICEMKCSVDNIETVFLYCFDKQDFLQKILMQQNDNEKCVFERNHEIKELKEQFTSHYCEKGSCI
jgi:hypothetical protein